MSTPAWSTIDDFIRLSNSRRRLEKSRNTRKWTIANKKKDRLPLTCAISLRKYFHISDPARRIHLMHIWLCKLLFVYEEAEKVDKQRRGGENRRRLRNSLSECLWHWRTIFHFLVPKKPPERCRLPEIRQGRGDFLSRSADLRQIFFLLWHRRAFVSLRTLQITRTIARRLLHFHFLEAADASFEWFWKSNCKTPLFFISNRSSGFCEFWGKKRRRSSVQCAA